MTAENTGCLYGIGVGPGDPELITLKGARLLRAADVILTPVGARSETSIAAVAVAPLLDPGRQRIVEVVCPMQSDEADRDGRWARLAAEVAIMVGAGQQVAFITLGDPMFYSTFLYLLRELRSLTPSVPVEIVPGISSVYAAAGLAGLPLGLNDETFCVVPATAPEADLEAALAGNGTVVLLKVYRAFDRLRVLLKRLGREQDAIYVRRIGLSGEAVIRDLDLVQREDLDYMSLLLVRRDQGRS
jgi:precorrin-2/cobalt-factor-2 C20-methyltransferase